MKILTLIASLALLFPSISPGATLADEGVILKSVITDLTSNFPMDEWGNPNSGLVWVDQKTSTLNVDLYSDPCQQLLPPRPGFVTCLVKAIPMKRVSFVTPLQSRFDGSCDRIIYTGQAPDPQIGGTVEIQISDNRRFENTCRSYLPMPPVSGVLKLNTGTDPVREIRFSAVVVEPNEQTD